MNYRTPRQRRAQEELVQIRAWMVDYLQRTVGPELTAEAAQAAIEQAKGWAAPQIRPLARYLEQAPNALTSTSPVTGPPSAVRLRHHLHCAGHQGTVAKAACAQCGRTDPLPLEICDTGRCCGWCRSQMHFRNCGRCGRIDQIVTHRDGVAICRRCYRTDPSVVTECARCRRMQAPAHRLKDGSALSSNCGPKPKQQCKTCGRLRPVAAHTPRGPVCARCYQSPMRTCGVCGQMRPIQVRAADGRLDVCVDCYRGPMGECSVCGRWRHGGRVSKRGGAFHCRSCWPRPMRTCILCGQRRRAKATWPLGPVCGSCHQQRRALPMPCSSCGDRRIIVGRADDGGDLCATCCGHQDPSIRCRSCGRAGDLFDDEGCPRCVLAERVRDLLSRDDGTIAEGL
ncbi:hypothetical protein AB0H82_34815 [Streptomyces sp. NPDC050732]|uniref:hypothetical protein n=1 Tax=Streptomyces sp. NPDC050732 TaxID=3154632 RepID=UPI0034445080